MKKIIFLLFPLTFILGGCTWMHTYQPDVQQGNLIPTDAAQAVKPGMSKAQVQKMLGSPVLEPLSDNHWAYVYTFQHNGGSISRKNLDIYFVNDRVARVTTSQGKIL